MNCDCCITYNAPDLMDGGVTAARIEKEAEQPRPLTTAARAEAERRVMGDSRFAHTTRDLLVGMAEWARDHLAAQEPTNAEVEAAARAIHINTIREFDDLGGLDQHALRARARKALSAVRAVGRDAR